jgi:hypothetical protein
MEISHYQALFFAYGIAMAGWLVANRLIPSLWPAHAAPIFEKPWKEIGWALLAGVGVVAIGQLYQYGIRLPGSIPFFGQILESINHLIIFSPFFLLLLLRKHRLSSAWLTLNRIWLRIRLGLALALIAIFVFTSLRTGSDNWLQVIPQVYNYQNLSHLVQVLLEDFAIAILFVRVRAAIGCRRAILLVAALFAISHIPAMLSEGASLNEFGGLILDTVLGAGVIYIVQKSADIIWFWCIHFAMDMMQFYAIQ